MPNLYFDLETYSDVPISAGTHAYAEGAEAIVAAWALDDGPVQVSAVNGQLDQLPVYQHLVDPGVTIVAHNSYFDRTILRIAHGIDIPADRWRDTMVAALAHSLPGALGKLSEILKLPVDQAKDKEGKSLIRLFCIPRPKNMTLRRATAETHPKEWHAFLDYARLDIEATRAIDKMLPKWNLDTTERRLWLLDQRINDRGVLIDRALVDAAIGAVEARQAQLAEEAQEITGGALLAATQRDALVDYINDTYNLVLSDVKGATVDRLLEDESLPNSLRALLEVRAQASTTSTAKYHALAAATSKDGRLRGTLQFCGAARTGRWAGRVFQPQNLPRPTMKNAAIEAGIEDLKAGRPVENVMALASSALRGTMIAPPWKKFVIADLSNIEGRVLAWLAGERWKIDAFQDFDQGTGHDLYKLAYSRSFGIKPETVTKDQRQIGKVQELALGYEGGVGAFVTFAQAYGIDLDDMAAKAGPSLAKDLKQQAEAAWAWAEKEGRTHGLAKDTWIACDAIKRAWRNAHGSIVEFWKDLQAAFLAALEEPGSFHQAGSLVAVSRTGAWTRIILPSGRSLCYPAATFKDGSITYMGVNQFTRKWERIQTYSGKLAENVTQAVARDVLASGMLAAEAAGYRIVLSVHDELITEVEDSHRFSADGLAKLMSTQPVWADGLPLAAAGFETRRYQKED